MVILGDYYAQEALFLFDRDFPAEYVDMAHPQDYKAVQEFTPQFIRHDHYGFHKKLIARIAFKASDGTALPTSFVCDTGAPGCVYLSPKAYDALKGKGLLLADEITGGPYVKIHQGENRVFNAATEHTPRPHFNANVLGVAALHKLHFQMTDDAFSFYPSFEYL